jgi:hypothetical protein
LLESTITILSRHYRRLECVFMQDFQLQRRVDRNQLRTVSDAIDALAQEADFGSADIAEIRVGILQLPSRQTVGLTNVSFCSRETGKPVVVWLATAAEFWAKREGEADARQFRIHELNGAKANNDGIVRLSDGTVLRAVEVAAARLPLGPSDLAWRIVHHVISIVKAEDQCYRSLREHAKSTCSDLPEEMIPETRFLNCSALEIGKLPPLKYLKQKIGRRDPSLKRVSHQTVADALRDFGIRSPASRPPRVKSVISP